MSINIPPELIKELTVMCKLYLYSIYIVEQALVVNCWEDAEKKGATWLQCALDARPQSTAINKKSPTALFLIANININAIISIDTSSEKFPSTWKKWFWNNFSSPTLVHIMQEKRLKGKKIKQMHLSTSHFRAKLIGLYNTNTFQQRSISVINAAILSHTALTLGKISSELHSPERWDDCKRRE